MYALVFAMKKFTDIKINYDEYSDIRRFLYGISGIELGPSKQSLVVSRLRKRLRHHDLASYTEYLSLIKGAGNNEERQTAINLLTTNETSFFRGRDHFIFLRENIFPLFSKSKLCRIWSAAASSGEEAYSIAMEMAEYFNNYSWQVFASDISTEMLKKASNGTYAYECKKDIPAPYLKKYCLKGINECEGTLLVDYALRKNVTLQQVNLMDSLPNTGEFDVIFLRNVLIYFDEETKKNIVSRISQKLKPGGYLFVGHSESIKNLHMKIQFIKPSIYRKHS